ncbi:hypothetical protein [uncultured Gelidibacter sp.]|uniref:hypothetical protein n=1 Tax=uncultured Gelidibacter sp. TaxID=259318 RepID=UPI0026042556|nr:hypothetical protein [uncultured Gelidibacter sp.]
MTKIRYTKQRLTGNLKMGIFFVAIGMLLTMLSFKAEGMKEISLFSVGVGQMVAGISLIIVYFFEKRNQYLTLKNGELIKNTLFPKKIKLSDIKSIQEFAGDYKLIREKNKFVINTQIIEPNSFVKLEKILKDYHLK